MNELKTLCSGLKKMAKWGTGPCGGGGSLDPYSQGRMDAEQRMRAEINRLLKEFEGKKIQNIPK